MRILTKKMGSRFCESNFEICPKGLVARVREIGNPALEVIVRVLVNKTGNHMRPYCRLSARSLAKQLSIPKSNIIRTLQKGIEKGIICRKTEGRNLHYYYPNWIFCWLQLTPFFRNKIIEWLPEYKVFTSPPKKEREEQREGIVRLTQILEYTTGSTPVLKLNKSQAGEFERGLQILGDRELIHKIRKMVVIEER